MTRMKHRRPSVSPLGAPLAQRVHSARVASSARSQQRVLAHVRVVNCCGRARRVLVEPERRGIGLLVGGVVATRCLGAMARWQSSTAAASVELLISTCCPRALSRQRYNRLSFSWPVSPEAGGGIRLSQILRISALASGHARCSRSCASHTTEPCT